jgi:ATP-dependent Lon protease
LFSRKLRELAEFVADGLPGALDADPVIAQRSSIQERMQESIREITEPLDKELRKAGMALVPMQQGPTTQAAIFPVVQGKPVAPSEFYRLAKQGDVPEEQRLLFEEAYPDAQTRVQKMVKEIGRIHQSGAEEIHGVNESAARQILESLVGDISARFPQESVSEFLGQVVQDVVDTRLKTGEQLPNPAARYGVNVIVEHGSDDRSPVVEENTPSLVNLLGTVEPEWGTNGPVAMDYRGIHAGALLRADGGYLILDVHDVLTQPGAWQAMMRTLRTGCLEIVSSEPGLLRPHIMIKPEPIDISVRVILIGDPGTYYQLDAVDAEFSDHFKVLADFDNELDRDQQGIDQYVSVLSRIVTDESLRHFDRSAVAALVEHGARIAARQGKLTARFGRMADIAREASFVAHKDDADEVSASHVIDTIRRSKDRAGLPSRKFQEFVNKGTIIVQTRGEVVGQVNGLAVISSGPLTYGFPARITATIGAGRAGLINIEGRAAMSGSIHTKGFHILGGLLRYLLKTDHPLAFSASIAFEQSYGGIDGDSASGAEICCLLSALTDVPIKQNLAMTGAIDQHGHVEAIGGVNEKIEGFYDCCRYFGLGGDQGVIIPKSNAGDLMLRHDLVEACERGEFRVFAVDNVFQALEVLTGVPVGEAVAGRYAEGTLLRAAVDRALEYWLKTMQSPDRLVSVDSADDSPEDAPG